MSSFSLTWMSTTHNSRCSKEEIISLLLVEEWNHLSLN